MLNRIIRPIALVALCAATQLAMAAYPDKPITLVVPWAPGGSTDILARAISQQMTTSMGQTVIVENKPGASGTIGAGMVAKAKPDGYTILIDTMSTLVINPSLMPNMPFKGAEDFTPIAILANVINTMVINPSVPVKTVAEFIAYAKANPAKLAYASAGSGSTNHLSAEIFKRASGIDMLHVPYKGGAPAVLDTVANQTQVLFTAGTQALPHVKSGKLTLLAVTEPKRASLLPDVPAVAETLPGFNMSVWYGAYGPAGMPRDVLMRLNAEIAKALAVPEVRARMDAMGVEVVSSSPEQHASTLRQDAERFDKIIKELKIKLD